MRRVSSSCLRRCSGWVVCSYLRSCERFRTHSLGMFSNPSASSSLQAWPLDGGFWSLGMAPQLEGGTCPHQPDEAVYCPQRNYRSGMDHVLFRVEEYRTRDREYALHRHRANRRVGVGSVENIDGASNGHELD